MVRFYQRKEFKYLLPFMTLLVGGSFCIREFTDIRFKYRQVQSVDVYKQDMKTSLKEKGIEMKESVSLEEEYEKMKDMDIEHWENKRIPRPPDQL